MDVGFGAGVCVEKGNIQKSYKRSDEGSIFEAEILSIFKATEFT